MLPKGSTAPREDKRLDRRMLIRHKLHLRKKHCLLLVRTKGVRVKNLDANRHPIPMAPPRVVLLKLPDKASPLLAAAGELVLPLHVLEFLHEDRKVHSGRKCLTWDSHRAEMIHPSLVRNRAECRTFGCFDVWISLRYIL
jgi:hypothetical protein